MSSPLSSFMVRGTDDQEPNGSFLSSLTSYNPQNPHFIVGQTEGLVSLSGTSDGTGSFVAGTRKVILQPRLDGRNGTTENILSGVDRNTEGAILSGAEKVVWQATTELEDTSNFLSQQERIIIQDGAEDEGTGETLLSSDDKVVLQDTSGRIPQYPLLYLDSTTGLHVLVHHLPNSMQNNAGHQGEDESTEQFVVVGALQSEEEQSGGVTEQSRQTPLTSHQPLNQENTCHVAIENMLNSRIMAAAGNASESGITAPQIFETHLDPSLDLHTSVQHQQISNSTLMDCSETPVLTLQVPQVKSDQVEIKGNILEAVPHISFEDIIDKFTSGHHEDVATDSHCAASSDVSFSNISLLKDASLEQHASFQDSLLQPHLISENGTMHQKASQETSGQHGTVQNISLQHYQISQNSMLQHRAQSSTSPPQCRVSRESRLQLHRATQDVSQQHEKSPDSNQMTKQLAQYSVRPLASLSGKSCEKSSIRVKVLDDHRELIPHSIIQGREDVGEQDGIDEESLYDVVMTYKCKLCGQVFEEKSTLLKHCREVHKPGGSMKIRVTTSEQSKSLFHIPPRLSAEKEFTNVHSTSITHKMELDGQENETPRELTIISCGFCSKNLLGEKEFQEHVKKDHHNERQESLKKKGRRRGPRHSHNRTPSYPSQPGLLVGHRKARSYTQQQDIPEQGKEQSGGKKRKVRTPKSLDEQYWLQKQKEKVKPVCSDDVEKSHGCPVQQCRERFSSSENLWLHQQCHGQVDGLEKGFVCPHCNQRFERWMICKLHLWKNHNVDVDLLTCGICLTYKTSTEQRLIVHQKTHSDVREHICKECNKGFRQLAQLLNHQVLHIKSSADLPAWKQKAFCQECQRWFGNKKTLKSHTQAVHMKLKPHTCPHCSYRCSRKFDLKVHLRQHSGERPHKCELCGMQYSDHNTLRRHKSIHLGMKTFRCPLESCMFETRLLNYFKQHMTRKHPNTNVIYKCQICSMKTPELQEYLTHSVSHEKQMVSETFRERLGKTSEEFNEVTVEDRTIKGKGPETGFSSMNTPNSNPEVITINLKADQGQRPHDITEKQPSIKHHNILVPEDTSKIKEIPVNQTSVKAESFSAAIAADETAHRVEGQSEELVTITMTGDGRQYIL